MVRDSRHARAVPKKWFGSEAAAPRAAVEQMSAEAMVKLLSPGNLAVLDAINRHHPNSLRELAALTGRKEASWAGINIRDDAGMAFIATPSPSH